MPTSPSPAPGPTITTRTAAWWGWVFLGVVVVGDAGCATTSTMEAPRAVATAHDVSWTSKPPTTPTDRAPSAEAARATLHAELLQERGDLMNAMGEWKAAVGFDPRSPYLQVRLAQTAITLGDMRVAGQAAERAIELSDDGLDDTLERAWRREALMVLAAVRGDEGNEDAAVASLRQALRDAPGDARVSALLADRLVNAEDFAAAEDVVEAWMSHTNDASGYVALARVYAKRGAIERAFHFLNKADKKIDGDVEALTARRNLCLALGRYAEAAAAARRLLQLEGDTPATRSGTLTTVTLEDRDAGREMARALVREDDSDRTRLLVADALEQAGDLVFAEEMLRPGGSPVAVLERARLLLGLHEAERAASVACGVADGASLEPMVMEFALSLCSRAEADAGNILGAMARLVEATTARPTSERLLRSMSALMPRASAGARAAARDVARRTLGLIGGVDGDGPPGVIIAVALILDAAAEHDEARHILNQLVARRPGEREVQFAFARLLEAQGRSQRGLAPTAAPGHPARPPEERRAERPDDQPDPTAPDEREAAADAKAARAAANAVEVVERLVARQGADVDTLNFMAFTLAEHGLRGEAAVSYAWRAVLVDPTNGYVADTWGWALVQAGRAAEGVAVLRRADRLAPGEAEIWFHLAVGLHRLARDDDARDAAARAEALLTPSDPLRRRLDALQSSLGAGPQG